MTTRGILRSPPLWTIVAIFAVLSARSDAQVVPTACLPDEMDASGEDCGDNSRCVNARCECDTGYFTRTGTHTDCQDSNVPDSMCSMFDPDCVYCGTFNEGPCRKCMNVISNGNCLTQCPPGTELELHNMANISLLIRTCTGSSFDLPSWAIVVIAVLGGVVLFIVAVLITSITCTFLRQSSVGQFNVAERTLQPAQQPVQVTVQEEKLDVETGVDAVDAHFEARYNPDFAEDEQDEEEFMRKLAVLRSRAEVFLKMLNDMRRRLKEIPQNTPAAQQYRNVMQDLTRLLYLLNKKPSRVQVPPDGTQLLNWSEQILERYLQTQGQGLNAGATQQHPTRLSVLGDQVETNF